MAAHQQVGSFEVVNQSGVLVKNGGNVASYFCTPDGRVIHAVTGPVPADELLAAARWSVDVTSDGKAVDDPGRIAAAHREELRNTSQPATNGAQRKIHGLLASRPLPPLNEVYRTVFEQILGQRISPPDTELVQAERAFAAARRAGLPVLLILHRRGDNQVVLEEWNRLVANPAGAVGDRPREGGERRAGPPHGSRSSGRHGDPAAASEGDLAATGQGPRPDSLTDLARSYVVVAMRLEELPALSHQLGIAPYAAPDPGTPLFVIARSDARQLSAVTTWTRGRELAYAMAQGIVQEAKEHRRTPEQLRELLAVVEPMDAGLGAEVRALLHGADTAGSPRAGRSGRPASRPARRKGA